MAAYVFDKTPPPPQLSRAWDYQAFGVNLLELPAGELAGVRMASNAHRALAGYKGAKGKTATWAKANPDAWEFVATVIEARAEIRKAEREMNG